jgi:hypothetical protein
MNTRKYPRTLADAFRRTPEYACAIEVGRRSIWERIGMWFARFFT